LKDHIQIGKRLHKCYAGLIKIFSTIKSYVFGFFSQNKEERMNIKVLGKGWARCEILEKTVREVVGELSVEAEIEHVRDIKAIMEYPILTTPGLVINEKLVSSRKVPSKEEVTTYITNAMS